MSGFFADAGLPVKILLIAAGAAVAAFCFFCMSRMFSRAREKAWKAFIPGYNLYILWKIGWNIKQFFVTFIPVLAGAYLLDILNSFGDTVTLIGRIIFYGALAFAAFNSVMMGTHLARRFDKPAAFGAAAHSVIAVGFLAEMVMIILGKHQFGQPIEYIFAVVVLLLIPTAFYASIAFSGSDYLFNRDPAGEASTKNTINRITLMRERRAMTGYAFVLPFVIGFLLFMVKPLVFSMQMSLNEVKLKAGGGFEMVWNNFNNYHQALQTDPNYNRYLVDEIGRMAINTIATLVMSFVIAVILNQKFKGRIFCRIIFFLPVILSSGVLPGIESSNEFYNMMSDISNTVQNSSGMNISLALQQLLQVSGVAGEVFDVIFQMIDAIYDIIMACGIQIIVFLSGLQSISPSLYEAADVEGCSAWESFWKITFPMVSPLLLVNCIYTIIDFFMKNDNQVIEYINTIMYGVQLNFGLASAMSWIYFGVALAFIGVSSFIIVRAVKSYE